LEKSRDIEKAILEYEKAVDADPYNPYPFLNLGTIHFNRGDLLLAKYYYWISLKNDPNYQMAKRNLDLCDRGMSEEKTIAPEKAFFDATERGQALFEQGDHAKAVVEFMRAAGAMPVKGETYRHLGEALIKLKRYSFAERNLTLALKMLGTDQHLVRLYADSLDGKGDLKKALAMFENILDDVENEEERQQISGRIANLKKRIGEVQKKVAAFEKEFSPQVEELSEKSLSDLNEFLWKRFSEGTAEEVIKEEVLKALQITFSETIFDNGLINITLPAGWYQVIEETKPGSPLVVFRRWPGDTQLALYSVEGGENLESIVEVIKELTGQSEKELSLRNWSIDLEVTGADAAASFGLDHEFENVGPQTLEWWVFHFKGCKSFCAAAALIGAGGLGKEEIAKISDELNILMRSISFRKEVWRMEEGICDIDRLYFPLPPEYTGPPPFSEEEMPWKVVQGSGFTLLVPPGVIARKMSAASPIPWRSANVLWMKGEFSDSTGKSVKIGDQEFYGYMDLLNMQTEKKSVQYTLGRLEPRPPLSDPYSKYLSGEDFTAIAKEAAACDRAWVGKYKGNQFSGIWLVFRMSFKKFVVEFGFPMVRGMDSPSIFWIPTTFRLEGVPTALPPVDAAEKFNISFRNASMSERRDPLGKEGDLYTPEFSLEIPSGWKPSINYRSIDGYPITVKELKGKAFLKIIKMAKGEGAEDAKRVAQEEICEECDFIWVPIKRVRKQRAVLGFQSILEKAREGELTRWETYVFETKKGDTFLLWGSIPQKEWDSFAETAIKKAISSLYFK
jgi:tetratricopeptide (TPR) repeat protein